MVKYLKSWLELLETNKKEYKFINLNVTCDIRTLSLIKT